MKLLIETKEIAESDKSHTAQESEERSSAENEHNT